MSKQNLYSRADENEIITPDMTTETTEDITNAAAPETSETAAAADAAEEAKAPKDKAAAFVKLAESRATRLLLNLESIGKLSGNAYSYTPEQIDTMFEALTQAMGEAYAKFQPKQKGAAKGKAFKF